MRDLVTLIDVKKGDKMKDLNRDMVIEYLWWEVPWNTLISGKEYELAPNRILREIR